MKIEMIVGGIVKKAKSLLSPEDVRVIRLFQPLTTGPFYSPPVCVVEKNEGRSVGIEEGGRTNWLAQDVADVAPEIAQARLTAELKRRALVFD